MKESASFYGNDIEPPGLNFSELRKLGLKYIQELSGNIWTDYNSHDPGVTILEQLCYALTDVALRTSLPIEDLLIPGKGEPINAKSNAFFAPSAIFSSHPVTINDTRKMVIDQFDEIQNVWIHTKGNTGYQEELKGINHVEILPKISFINALKSNPAKKESFLNKVNNFLHENRCIGETFEGAKLLEPQIVHIEFNIHADEKADLEATLSNVLLKLFEFIYSPVQYNSFNEMQEQNYSLEEMFSGPLLNKGFLKNDIPENRLTTIHIDELQKLFSKINGIRKCDVKGVNFEGRKYSTLEVQKNKFFHLLDENDLGNISENRFDGIYSNMNVFINYKPIYSLNRQRINNLFLENWSKKHRGYSLKISRENLFSEKLNGNYRDLNEYYSIQNHFPVIYGIGKEGLSQHEPVERHAKALQLKAYLMLFEQHFANHLSQLGNLNDFFNIDFEKAPEKTCFSQSLSTSVPYFKKLINAEEISFEHEHEQDDIFYERKHKIYNHLLARFGEELNEIPWQIAFRINMIKSKNEFNRILLQKKSEFLTRLEDLGYNRLKGESFHQNENQEFSRIPSGLEQIILVKTGIPARSDKSLVPDFSGLNSHLKKLREEPVKDKKEFNKKYRPLLAREINNISQLKRSSKIPNAMFGEIGLKALFKETLNYENYRLSIREASSDNVDVIFQKQPNKWVNIFECSDEEEAVQSISQIIDFFVDKNIQSEGIYLVDNILLNDFIGNSKFGFCFTNEYGNHLFHTDEEESWSSSEEDRNKRISEFYESGILAESYFFDNGKWMIKNKQGEIIASFDTSSGNLNSKNDSDELLKQTKSLVQLFGLPKEKNGRTLLQEVEKIRLKGSVESGIKNYGQRRLVFQRKLSSGEIIDEDFFDMNITLILPDWPARFQEERFKDYVTDIFYERMPAHLNNRILWLNANEMKEFEEKYHSWEKLKAGQTNYYESSGELKKAAFEVYQTMMKLKQNR